MRLAYTAMFFAVLEWPGESSVRYGALHYVPACSRQNDRLWKCCRNKKRPYHVWVKSPAAEILARRGSRTTWRAKSGNDQLSTYLTASKYNIWRWLSLADVHAPCLFQRQRVLVMMLREPRSVLAISSRLVSEHSPSLGLRQICSHPALVSEDPNST